jgi:serine/threonine-protein kinase
MAEHPGTIGRYRIDGIIGEGAMGIVYRGHDPGIDRVVAIKTLHAHLVAARERAGWLERFAREARAAGRCLHPNLVTVFDCLEEGGLPWLVMEFVDAPTLEQRMAGAGPQPPALVLSILRQLLDALGYIHGAGIVHRDVKPANLMIMQDGRVKLADFGVARIEALGATHGGMIGTPAYMSAEQFAGRPADHRADLFAAGAILFELLTGLKAFPATALGELAQMVTEGRHLRLAEVAPGLPRPLDALLDRALAADPARRFASAAELSAAILGAFGGDGAPAASAWDRTVVAPPPARAALAPTLAGSLAARIPPALLARLETLLAERVGPMASRILRRAIASTADIERLVETLAAEVDARERAEFVPALRRLFAGGSLGSATTAAASGHPPERLAELARLLTPHVGPIARHLVRRAAETHAAPDALLDALARHIEAERDRTAFYRSVA